MTVVIMATIIAFIVIGVVMSRQTRQRKDAAIEDLKREKKEVGHVDIFALVTAEVDELDLRSIPGAEELQPEVLLKVWKDNTNVIDQCDDRANLRFVHAPTVDPQKASSDDITLVCDGRLKESPPPANNADEDSPG
ncbi:MAG: hypothetical protein M3132_11795 [Actinomycetia bacterium]|nr:hypothetical protein [Actinomycetes bacterium]